MVPWDIKGIDWVISQWKAMLKRKQNFSLLDSFAIINSDILSELNNEAF